VAQREHVIIVHASRNDTDQSTTIFVTVRHSQPATNALFVWNVLNMLTPPSSIPGSAGQMVNIAAHALTDTNTSPKLRVYWERDFHRVASSVAGAAVPDGELDQATRIRLPATASANASESDLLFITPRSLSLIHLVASSNQTSKLIIGSITQ